MLSEFESESNPRGPDDLAPGEPEVTKQILAMYYLLAVSVIAWYGCGDSPTKSEHEALEDRVAVLEEVFLSNVVLNTEAHVVAVGGNWAVFGGTITPSYSWRFTERVDGIVHGGYTIDWTNNTNSDITVTMSRLVFEDSNGIQIAEDDYLSSTFNFDEFTLDAGQSRERQGNFSFSATVPAANEISRMTIWAGFTER